MTYPLDVKEDAHEACVRSCSISHKLCGTKIEVHHIKQNRHEEMAFYFWVGKENVNSPILKYFGLMVKAGALLISNSTKN